MHGMIYDRSMGKPWEIRVLRIVFDFSQRSCFFFVSSFFCQKYMQGTAVAVGGGAYILSGACLP